MAMPERVPCEHAALWGATARWVEAALGLHFPAHRAPDLQRGLDAAACRLGLPDGTACAQQALAGALGEEALDIVASCLAIGETYLFRDPELFERLEAQVLGPLIAARRQGSRRLRLWSAGCSSGEEAYSLAMLVAALVPDWRAWDLQVLGTDLHAAALRKARAAAYGRWSLRSPIAPRLRQFLQQGADGRWHVHPELRARVRFERLNLAAGHYPSPATHTTDIDLVLCRNVLIYFEEARRRAVLQRLGRCLAEDGWLVTGSVELPAGPIPGLHLVRTHGLFALRRGEAATAQSAPLAPAAAAAAPAATPCAPARSATPTRAQPAAPAQQGAAAPGLLEQARRCADAGDLAGAEQLCHQAIAQDGLDPGGTYLLASVLAERGAVPEAMAALQRTLYLDPGHLLAHFNLGSLALRQGQHHAARRHLARALARLAQRPAEKIVPGSGGLTTRALQDAIRRAGEAAG